MMVFGIKFALQHNQFQASFCEVSLREIKEILQKNNASNMSKPANKEDLTNKILDHINRIGYDKFLEIENDGNSLVKLTDVLNTDIETLKKYFGDDLEGIIEIAMDGRKPSSSH